MNWKKVNKCKHKWSDNYVWAGTCLTPFCEWTEQFCVKCRVYQVTCGCGFENRLSGEPLRVSKRRERSNELKKQLGEEGYRAVTKLLRPSKKWKDVTGLYSEVLTHETPNPKPTDNRP